MKQITTIGLDLAKQVFQIHGADAEGSPIVNRKLRRAEVLRFFEKQPACLVGIEACGSSHYWAREIAALGHEVRLIPPAYVKPFVKRGKTDAADAEAISEAVTRKTMRFVPIKTAEQQAAAMVLKTRSLLVRQQTQAINALRPSGGIGHHCRHRYDEGCRADRDRTRCDRCSLTEGCALRVDGRSRSDRGFDPTDR